MSAPTSAANKLYAFEAPRIREVPPVDGFLFTPALLLVEFGRWDDIRDGFLRDFTQAAMQARVPVLLGGHSLMAGGLMALNEYAWRTLGDG